MNLSMQLGQIPGIEQLLRDFYDRARQDELLGPIFNSVVSDWEYHIQNVVAYWHRQTNGEPALHRTFPSRHLPLKLQAAHFQRWLDLFKATATEHFNGEPANAIYEIARGVAANLFKQVLPDEIPPEVLSQHIALEP